MANICGPPLNHNTELSYIRLNYKKSIPRNSRNSSYRILMIKLITNVFFTITVSVLGYSSSAFSQILLLENFNEGYRTIIAFKLLNKKQITLVKNAGPDNSTAIRVAYIGGKMGSQRVIENFRLPKKVNSATLSFDVKFSDQFQWGIGGKLHGLGPKNTVTGGEPRRPDGWSSRIMFRSEGVSATYLYDQSKNQKYGMGNKSNKHVFVTGKWQHVSLHIKLNDPPKNNGFSIIRIDNQIVAESYDVNFREFDNPSTRINSFLFNTFHGGNNLKWAPKDTDGKPTTVHAFFDNFKIIEGYLSTYK